ncbi:hypothetical protein C8J57DRAFT_1727982 [Mycena rebaudengoi]|nr:hypothetical protein C8J57DRAFT_1727982 [Mycena rebaudengoi]
MPMTCRKTPPIYAVARAAPYHASRSCADPCSTLAQLRRPTPHSRSSRANPKKPGNCRSPSDAPFPPIRRPATLTPPPFLRGCADESHIFAQIRTPPGTIPRKRSNSRCPHAQAIARLSPSHLPIPVPSLRAVRHDAPAPTPGIPRHQCMLSVCAAPQRPPRFQGPLLPIASFFPNSLCLKFCASPPYSAHKSHLRAQLRLVPTQVPWSSSLTTSNLSRHFWYSSDLLPGPNTIRTHRRPWMTPPAILHVENLPPPPTPFCHLRTDGPSLWSADCMLPRPPFSAVSVWEVEGWWAKPACADPISMTCRSDPPQQLLITIVKGVLCVDDLRALDVDLDMLRLGDVPHHGAYNCEFDLKASNPFSGLPVPTPPINVKSVEPGFDPPSPSTDAIDTLSSSEDTPKLCHFVTNPAR